MPVGSNDLSLRLEVALASGAAKDEIVSLLAGNAPYGRTIYVDAGDGGQDSDSNHGSDTNDGFSADRPLATIGQAFTNISALPLRYRSDGVIRVRGHLKEQVAAPLGAYGWKIIGAAGGRPRHSTSDGAFLDSNGCHWSEEATATNAPLLTLREHGWEVYGIMFVPESGYPAIRLRREETATYPDASHSKIALNRFFQSGAVGQGIDDYGAGSHALIAYNEFEGLEFGYKSGNVGISAPNRHHFYRNDFNSCKNDIVGNFYGTKIEANVFRTVYHATTHPNTVNCAYTADAGVAANGNRVFDNHFADNAADVTIAKGYKPATGDVWRNFVANTAAYVVTVPT